MIETVVAVKFLAIFGAVLWYSRRLSRERRERDAAGE